MKRLVPALLVAWATQVPAAHLYQNPCGTGFLLAIQALSEGIASKSIQLPRRQFRHTQRRLREIYQRAVVPDMRANPSPYRELPSGIDPQFEANFRAVWALRDDPMGYFDLGQQFELFVFTVARRNGIRFEDALPKVLAKREAYYGFKTPRVVTEFLPNEKFLSLIAGAIPVQDEFWRGKPHTAMGHRIQSLLQAMHLEKTTGDRHAYVRLYAYLGSVEAAAAADWSPTGVDRWQPRQAEDAATPDFFGYLYDVPFFRKFRIDPADFSNPEYFAGLRYFLPALIGWQ